MVNYRIYLILVKNDKQSGLDILDGSFIRIIADYIAEPMSHFKP